jgi:hypothetical protein
MKLPCPCCGAEDVNVRLSLDDGKTLTCDECNTDFYVSFVEDVIAKWSAVLPWLKSFPAAEPES